MATLKQIKEISEKGCIEDQSEVASIISDFLSLSLESIFESVKGVKKDAFEYLATMSGLDGCTLGRINYLELLCMICNLENTMNDYNGYDTGCSNAEEFKRFIIEQLKRILVESGKSNMVVREFLGITVPALFEYFEGRHHDLMADSIYRHILSEEKSVVDSEVSKGRIIRNLIVTIPGKKRNIKDFLSETTEICNGHWRCWENINGYKWIVLTANQMETELLLSGFVTAYRERMNISDLLEKYKSPFPNLTVEEAEKLYPEYEYQEREETGNGKNN